MRRPRSSSRTCSRRRCSTSRTRARTRTSASASRDSGTSHSAFDRMQTFNRIANAVFDPLLAPFGHEHAAFDLVLWPALMGVLAIALYKVVSNQKSLARVKSQISMRLLEIRLFSHDILQVLRSTGM